jgi:hypothetical protein
MIGTALRRLPARLALLAAVFAPPAGAGELGINVYGLSYHFDRDTAKALGVDNGINPGLGVRYRFAEYERWSFFADAGAYDDSGRNTAVYAGAGAYWRAWGGLHLGAALAVFNSDTYNNGRTFVAPVPLVGYDFGPAMVNLTFFPRVSEFNDVATLALWVTLWPERW